MSITRDIVQDIVYDIAQPITGAALDADAAAYIAAVEATGATVTGAQSSALNTFFSAGWTRDFDLKRLFLFNWGVEGANKIDLVTLGTGVVTGEFNLAETGYATGNGTTGRFGFGASPNAMGLDHGVSAMMGCLIAVAQTQTGRIMSAQQGIGNLNLQKDTSTTLIAHSNTGGFNAYVNPLSYANTVGVICNHRWSSTEWEINIRKTSGVTRQAGYSGAAGTDSCSYEMTGWARNSSGTYSDYTDPGLGALFAGLGFATAPEMDAFTLAIAALWEGVSGLSLP